MGPSEGQMDGSSDPRTISTRQGRIAELARQMPEAALTPLAHHMDEQWLRAAYEQTRKDGAVGIDQQTAADYAQNLTANLADLKERVKSYSYRAPAVRRAYIPKGDGQKRPLGIPTFEDKVLQRAVSMLLEPLYEQDFLDCSYGFRPKRSAHQALASIREQARCMGGCWLLDVDIRGFFDNLDHGHLRELLQRRVRDGVVLRTIGKWLNAGVLEDGARTHPGRGTPQGGVLSPLLANVYRHHVLDEWVERDVKPRLHGRAFLVRYADDFVIGFEERADAERVLAVLGKRLGRHGLAIHPEKTRLVDFRKPDREKGGPRPGTFDFLGFTYYWGKSRKGKTIIKWKTARKRLSRALKAIGRWCRSNRHSKVAEQCATLGRKLRGHYAYFGLTGNYRSLEQYYRGTYRQWRKWLDRRSQKRRMKWDRFNRLLARHPLPSPKVVHSIYRVT